MHTDASDKIHRIIMQAFDEIARRMRADEPTTEYDIQQFMVRRYAEENLESDNEPPIVAVNANAANPHYEPTRDRHAPIKRGDFVLFDVWAKLKKPNAVYTDQTWTGYVGESVPEEYTRIFNIVREARDAAVKFVRRAYARDVPLRARTLTTCRGGNRGQAMARSSCTAQATPSAKRFTATART